jgi:hypothetical protein
MPSVAYDTSGEELRKGSLVNFGMDVWEVVEVTKYGTVKIKLGKTTQVVQSSRVMRAG